jgi:hypothetical protein
MNTYRVWHGTCKSFQEFNLRAAYPQSAAGRGFYFTDCINDAESYSSNRHGDHRVKIDEVADRIMDRTGLPYERARMIAARKYQAQPRVIECEITMRRPLECWVNQSHIYIQRRSLKRVEKILASQPEDAYSRESAYELIMALYDGVNTYKLFRKMQCAGLSVFPKLVRALGYDGCIMYNTADWFPGLNGTRNSNHYIVYSRKQIKKVAENLVPFA